VQNASRRAAITASSPKALDGADHRTVATAGVSDARARGHAVDLDSAGAAHAMLAADMRAGQQQAAA